MSLLTAQAVQIPLQLRCSPCRMVGETTRACSCPEGAVASSTAFGISLIHPIPLRLPEALLEVGTAGLATLREQVLIGAIEIGIVLHYRTIEAGALISRRRRVARIT